MTRPWRDAQLVVAASALVRLVIAALTPIFPDEAYYWEWSRHLAWGYYDHPPLIAWLIRAGTVVAGVTPFGVRVGAVIAGALASWLLAAAARRLAGDRAALLAAMVFAVMPLSAAGLVLATPDAPLFAAAAATVYALVRALESAPRSTESTLWWCAAGAALGLAFDSKITSALLPFAAFVAILALKELRPRLREPGPYLAIAIALTLFAPVIVWNSRHAWISFAFQLQHGLGGAGGSVLKREGDLLGGQAGLVSPILFVLIAIAVVHGVRDRAAPTRSFLAVVALVLFGFFVYSASRRRVEANWPALAYLPGVLLLVSYPATTGWTKWLRGGIGLAAVLTLVAYVNAFVSILPVPARRDPAARASGWQDLAAAVRAAMPDDRAAATHVAADRYQEASALAWHLPGHPETFSLNLSSRANQYDLWPGFAQRARAGDDMILALDDLAGTPTTVTLLAPHFTGVSQGPPVQLQRGGDLVKNLRLWSLRGWRGTWPTSRLRSRT